MNNNKALDTLLQQPGIWRAGQQARNTGLSHVSSGFSELDAALPGDGWPLGALTEILHDRAGIGELRLVMPALAHLSRQGRWVVLVAPPHIPYAPAMAACGVDLTHLLLVHPRTPEEELWAIEQALRTGTCGAVFAWTAIPDQRRLRRLQLAAEAGHTWGVLFRHSDCARQASPAALRLQLERRDELAAVRVLKCRGAPAGQELLLDLDRVRSHGEIHRPASDAPPRTRMPTPPAPLLQKPSVTARGVRSGTQPRRSQMELPMPLAEQPASVCDQPTSGYRRK